MAEPIAVIGLDAKYPCDGNTPEKFYEFLVAGRSARGPVPPDRYNANSFWHPDSHRDGIIGGRQGHFIQENVKAFDAPFFSITPAEAASMDPQQRLLLECVYTALENAGLTMEVTQGSLIGTYVGAFIWDYRDVLIKDVDAPMMYTGSGTIASTLAGRVNWFYDFHGPAFSVDTACSSSMVALHQAVVALKAGDCNTAIACGTNLILSPEMGLELNALGVLNQDGISYSFDDRANGYGRSEGIGAVVLKRMSDALRDGDTIRAVIRNTGANHDGHSPGLTAPSGEAQAELMRKTYAQAGLDPSRTRFFEAHGTGTPVGDPIEANAISLMFSQYRSPDEPLYIGAVKSNIGHSEGASGIASVIKSILTLERGIIPANHWFEKRNPKIPDEWHFQFPTKALPWPKTETGLRRMSINSFGVSGTNAHVVMEDALHFLRERNLDAPHRTIDLSAAQGQGALLIEESAKTNGHLGNGHTNGLHTNGNVTNRDHAILSPQLFVLSSHDQDGISRLCNAYKGYLPSMSDSLSNLSFTLATKRSQFNWRAAIVADSVEVLQEALSAKQQITRVATGPGLALVFTGQGAQWARMGLGLMQYPSFRQSLELADIYLKTLGSTWSAISELSKEGPQSRINEAEFSQPLCTVLQVALVDLLAFWGVKARAVAGHSSGEIAAAYCVGAISKESAWKISYWRGNMSAKLARSSSQTSTTMAAVGLDYDGSIDAIERVNKSGFQEAPKLAVACMNSKDSHTISGDAAQIEALVQMLADEKIFARKLAVEMAYHSRYMEPMSEEYAKCMGEIQTGVWTSEHPQPKFFSSTYGNFIGLSKLGNAAYWTKNLVSPVRFHESMSAMLQATVAGDGESTETHLITDILEVGPHVALKGPLRNIVDEVRAPGAVRYQSMLKRGGMDMQCVLEAAGSLFCRGIQVDLEKVNHIDGVKPAMMIDLPRYPFNHSKEYWYESRLSRNFRNRAYPRHELLGAPVNDWDGKQDAIWRNWIRLSENPWVEQHTVSGSVLYPAAGMLVMVIEGCRQLAERYSPDKQIKGFRFREISFKAALHVADDSMGTESHLYLRPVKQAAMESKPSPWREFQICTAQEDDEWREHCRGQVLVEYHETKTAVDNGLEETLLRASCNASIDEAQQKCTSSVATNKIYDAWEEVGFVFGPTFRTVSNVSVDHTSGKVCAKVTPTLETLKKLVPHGYVQPHLIHPTTLDGTLQASMAPIVSHPTRKQKNATVPTFLDELWVSASTHPEEGYLISADCKPHGRKEYASTCTAVDPSTREPMVLFKGLVVQEVDGNEASDKPDDDPKHRAWNIDWKVDPELLSLEESKKAFGTKAALQNYLDSLAHKNPAMKILEIGNGASRATSDILSTLGQRFLQYDFTDTSSATLDKVRETISDDRVHFQVFDIEKEPAAQDFKAGTYDAVIASAGHRLTTNIDTALGTILTLLKPGGKLVFAAEENSETVESWGTHLKRCGYSDLEAAFEDQTSSIVISSAPLEEKEMNGVASTLSSYYIVIEETSDRQRQIAEKLHSVLSARGQSTTMGTLSKYGQWAAAVTREDLENSTCILMPELEAGLLTSVTAEVLANLQQVMNSKRVLWMTKDGSPDTDLVTGFATVIRQERPELEYVIIHFQPEESIDVIADKLLDIDTAVTATRGAIETSYKVVEGLVHVPRLVEASTVTKHIKKQTSALELDDAEFGADSTRSLSLQIQDIGLLDSLYFNDDPIHATPLADTEVEFETKATAVNFKDLAVMLGKINETPVGLEAAGIVTRVGAGVTRFKAGDRVFGFAFRGAFSTHVRALEGTIAHIPETMTFAEAAVIPIVYTTAYACLYDIGDLGKRSSSGRKSTVLIHAAAGGVGQAAIQLAQRENADIFVTVGSLEKREFLEKTYGLPRDHIFSSRDVSFKAGIMRMTNGRGVDIIINSLSGDMLQATWECVAPFGCFAEIGLTDIESRARISMGVFARSARFQALELNYMQQTDMKRIEDLFERTIDSVVGRGLERSTPITKYSISQLQDALRHMQSGKHIGKLVVEPHETDLVPVVQLSRPSAKFLSDATYVVSGGLGGLGRQIIRWMVNQGARNLIVTSRQGPKSEAATKLVEELQGEGVKISAPACDITDRKSLEKVFSACLSEMPPIRGCIQAAMYLDDNLFKDMSLDQWQAGFAVKVDGTRNLWEVLNSSSQNHKLDFFVMLSSMVSVIGNPQQASYAAGNSYQDALAKHLSAQGHNAVALNAPMMTGAGMLTEKPLWMEYFFSIGWSHMSSEELIAALDYYCRPLGENNKAMTPKQAQVVPRLWLNKYTAAEGAEQPTWQHEPRFNHMIFHGADNGRDASATGSGKGSASTLLSAAKSMEEAETIVLDALLQKMTKILSVEMAELDPAKPLHAYGIDSLVGVELRTWMGKEIGAEISMFEITGGQHISQLAGKAARTSRFVQVAGK